MIETVYVPLPNRSYNVRIGYGLLARAGAEIAPLLHRRRVAVVTDETVADLHLAALERGLAAEGIEMVALALPPGEATKGWAQFSRTVEWLLEQRVERRDVVVALGGGVIGDLVGFAAAVLRRGVRFVQIPSSLLAQVDSSVGGKTGINAPQGKNLIGAFYQPRLVLADTGALDTLPKREFRAGYAEVVKYGLIDRPDFFSWLEANWPKIEAGGPERIHAIAESCRAKADVVARDERETGDRALLNLGHTFGHALEAAAKYDPQVLVHGEGVAIGLVLAHQFSSRMNLSSPDDANRVAAHLETAGLPTNLDAMKTHLHDAETMLGFIRQDKKVTRGALNFILTHGIGQSFIAKDVPESEVRSFLAEKIGA